MHSGSTQNTQEAALYTKQLTNYEPSEIYNEMYYLPHKDFVLFEDVFKSLGMKLYLNKNKKKT